MRCAALRQLFSLGLLSLGVPGLMACRDPLTKPPLMDMTGAHPTMHWMHGPSMPFDKPRSGLPLVQVPAERRLVGYGGTPLTSTDTWAFSLKDDAWTTLILGVAPPAGRMGHCAAYLPAQNQILYVGGHNDSGPASPPAMSFTEGTPGFLDVKAPSYAPTEGCAAAYLEKLSRAVIFGGELAAGVSDQTWLFDGAALSFTRAMPAQSPPARKGAALVFDAGATADVSAAQLVLFGGTDGTIDFSDVWLFDGSSWGEIGTTADPDAAATDEPRPLGRSGAAVTIDPARRLLYVFGGLRQGQMLDDLWRLDLRTFAWQRLNLDPRPAARMAASVAYDTILDRLLMFGGTGSDSALSDGWVLAPAS